MEMITDDTYSIDCDKVYKELRQKLREYNREKCSWLKENSPIQPVIPDRLSFICNNTKYGEACGGLFGHVEYNWLCLDQLYVDNVCRGQNIGTQLMHKAEDYAKEHNLTGIKLDTWDFQAKPFYEKLGYEVYAELKDCPPGTITYFLKKEL